VPAQNPVERTLPSAKPAPANSSQRKTAIKLADTNVGGGDGFVTLPLYALGFLDEQDEELTVAPVSIQMP
jgi:hypothetical protein